MGPRDYIEITNSPTQLTDRLTSLGLESYYKEIEPTFNNVVLGKVIECKKHQNSDHLHICKVKVSDDKVCQIICGAPNISSDIYVPVALVGAELLDGKFIIKKSYI